MKGIHFFQVACIILLVLHAIPCVITASPYSHDKWKEILAIGEDKDYTIAAELTLNIEPDQYYRKPGDEIVLSGILKGIFGPLSGSDIIIERKNSSSEVSYLNTSTNDSGIFVITDLLTEPGIYSYQAIYEPDQKVNSKNMKSERLEITCIQSDTTTSFEPDERYLGTGDHEVTPSDKKGGIMVHLTSNTSGFIPGQAVSFSGQVRSDGGPIAYAKVSFIPEVGLSRTGEPVIYQTRKDGTMNATFHLTDPDSLSFSLLYRKNRNEPEYQSDPVFLVPSDTAMNPPARIVHTSETIDAFIDNTSVKSMQNVTLYGWYCKKEGEPGFLSALDLVWYNFGGKVWDQYPNSSKILTNGYGFFECTVPAPFTPGMYVMAVKREGNSTTPSAYSNVLPLTVTPLDEESDEVMDVPVSSPGQILINATPVPARVLEEGTISVVLSGFDSIDADNLHLSIYSSTNSIDWYLFDEISSVLPSEEIIIPVLPEKEGYLYFKATVDNHEGVTIHSPILVIPVIL